MTERAHIRGGDTGTWCLRSLLMRAAVLLLSVILLSSAVIAQPASGLYLTLRQDFLDQIASDVGLSTANYVNSDTNIPAQSGSNSQVSYTLSNFLMDMDLDQFNLSSANPPVLSVTYVYLRTFYDDFLGCSSDHCP